MFKICIVSNTFKGGGLSEVAINLANMYANKGYQVILVVMTGERKKNNISENVKVISLKLSRIRAGIFKLGSIFKTEKPDSILSVSFSTNIIVGIAHSFFYSVSKLVFRQQNLLQEINEKGYWERLLYFKSIKLIYPKASIIIANSEDTKQELISLFKNKKSFNNKVKVIHNPVLPINFKERTLENLNHKWLIKNKYKIVLSVGRLVKQKNHKLLINAFAKVKNKIQNSKLIILGSGYVNVKQDLLNLSKSLGLENEIDFVKYQDNPYPFYNYADVFVLSSIYEGFGNVIVEALACGTPVVSTNCPGGPKDILENGKYGKLVPVNDVDAMAEAIISTLTQVDEHDAVSLRIQRAQDFSAEKIANDYLYYLTKSI